MALTVFYAWQNDLPLETNRRFIEEALKEAIKGLKRDGIDLDPRPGQDARGVPGAADVVAAIFSRINNCAVFVGDVSIINGPKLLSLPSEIIDHASWRLTPNPNVLTELGYAARCLSWDNVIPVFNEAFGTIEQLPFDIRGKQILRYTLNPGEEPGPVAKAKAVLTSSLTGWLRASLRGIEDRARTQEADLAQQEKQRQNRLLAALRQEFVGSHDNVRPSTQAGTEPLPNDWVEGKLIAMGETWRRSRYCELD